MSNPLRIRERFTADTGGHSESNVKAEWPLLGGTLKSGQGNTEDIRKVDTHTRIVYVRSRRQVGASGGYYLSCQYYNYGEA
jgi:hypothetical protein